MMLISFVDGINKIMFTLEICIESVESALIAQEAGADRVELCANLLEGGTTPSFGMIKRVRESIDIELAVMIRPRGGDFCYTEEEFSIMKEDILIAKSLGADCAVFGIILPRGDIDIKRTSELVTLANPMQVTFHRAFDVAKEPLQALEDIIATGADRLLTSGQEAKAIQGKELIKILVSQANNRISIMAGSGVNPQNRDELLTYCGVSELHLTAKTIIKGEMQYRSSNLSFKNNPTTDDYQREIVSRQIVADIKKMK